MKNEWPKYYTVPGMRHPRWVLSQVDNYPSPGKTTVIAHNLEADTDMADMDEEEFFAMFPKAQQINMANGSLMPPEGAK